MLVGLRVFGPPKLKREPHPVDWRTLCRTTLALPPGRQAVKAHFACLAEGRAIESKPLVGGHRICTNQHISLSVMGLKFRLSPGFVRSHSVPRSPRSLSGADTDEIMLSRDRSPHPKGPKA